jgi:hypothetical protein
MSRQVMATGALLLLCGCAAARVRSEAALALNCPELEVTVTEKKPGTWLGAGCDKTTLCSLGSGSSAEPACVTGIPNEEPPKKPASEEAPKKPSK